jgi:hypothetical protein
MASVDRAAIRRTRERSRELGYLLVGLADLVEKYEALVDLRDGAPERTIARRDAMRGVASRFPGALRELEQISPPDLDHRAREVLEGLERLLHDLERSPGLRSLEEPEHRWMLAAAELHAYLKELLKVKRWLSERPPAEDAGQTLEGLRVWHLECGDARWPVSHWTAARLTALRSPPRRRATDLAYEEVAARHGLTADGLRHLLFPLAPRG